MGSQRTSLEHEATKSNQAGPAPTLRAGEYIEAESSDVPNRKNFGIQYAVSGRARCKKCGNLINKGEVRLYKQPYNFKFKCYLKQYYHTLCLFKTFSSARVSINVINNSDDIEGLNEMSQTIKDTIEELIVKHKRIGLPDRPGSSKQNLRNTNSDNKGTPSSYPDSHTATVNKIKSTLPAITVTYTNADVLTSNLRLGSHKLNHILLL